MDSCTENYECLVLDNTSKSNKIEDCVFWYKGENHEDYKLGSNQFWVNNEFEDDGSSDEEFSMDRFKTKKNSTRINVRKND